MEDRCLIEIPLDDSELLPPLYEYFKSFWSDTRQEPRAHYNRFIANTPIADAVVFRPAAASDPPGLWCRKPCLCSVFHATFPRSLFRSAVRKFSLTIRAAMLLRPAKLAHRSCWRCGRVCTTYSSLM